MKVLYITSFLGNKGGIGRQSFETIQALREQGATVQPLTENNHEAKADEHNVLMPVLRISGWKKWLYFAGNCLKVRREAKSFDIIHAADGWPYAIYGWFAAIGTSKRLYMNGIGTYTVEPLSAGGIKEHVARRAYLAAKGIFCISEYVKDRVKKELPGANALMVFMGTNELPALSEQKVAEYRIKYGLEDRFPVVLSVGDIKDRKGQLDTLKALVLLKEQFPKFMYVLVGSEEDIVYVEKIRSYAQENGVSDNLKIVSNMYDDAELAFYYGACDLFVLNSTNDKNHFEGFGLVFLEAARFGKPSVGSRGCGIESAIQDGQSGYLTNQSDPADIAKKIQMILKEAGDAFSARAREFAQQFSWRKTAAAYLAEYRKYTEK